MNGWPQINRDNPTCFLFLIDQSGSMAQEIVPGSGRTKAQALADAINGLLQNLIHKCSPKGEVYHYCDVGVIGYCQPDGDAPQIRGGFTGDLAGKELVSITDIANKPARIEEQVRQESDGAGGMAQRTVRFRVWFDAIANGGTPMCQAMHETERILAGWLPQHLECFPPVVMHITDGESTDGDPTEAMRSVTNLSSAGHNVLLFNIHLSSNPLATPIVFPDASVQLPDRFARMLFDTASSLPPFMRSFAKANKGVDVPEQAKGFVLNADMALVVTALDVGTHMNKK